jgi:hypothetical protein
VTFPLGVRTDLAVRPGLPRHCQMLIIFLCALPFGLQACGGGSSENAGGPPPPPPVFTVIRLGYCW